VKPPLFAGVFLLSVLALVVALRFLPRRGVYAPESAPERSSFAVVRRDYPFLLFVGSTVLASMTYVSIDALLPSSLAISHGIAPAVWGFLIIINAGLVTLVQLRLATAVALISPSVKPAVARLAPADIRGAYMPCGGGSACCRSSPQPPVRSPREVAE
jgi:hypothetical protein